ncbi:unnamed protein product, partial [Effrenium voratum]
MAGSLLGGASSFSAKIPFVRIIRFLAIQSGQIGGEEPDVPELLTADEICWLACGQPT